MSNKTEYNNITAFHPGYYIAEIIEDMAITQAEFAIRMGTTPKTLSQLVNGQTGITNDLAKKLSVMTGMSVEVWQNLQNTYDRKCIEIEQKKDFAEQGEIAKQIDYRYFVDYLGLPETRSTEDRILNLCRYLRVSDLRTMKSPDYLVNFRRSSSADSQRNLINSKIWIQTALNMAESIETKPYDESVLKGHLNELRGMTVQSPDCFVPRMQEIMADSGIAFVILPYLKNSGVNGAVKWARKDKAVLAINNRGMDADRFWFSLFHEIKHVLQRKVTALFLHGSAEEMMETNEKLEKEADKFASDLLISPTSYKKFAPTKYTSDKEIREFAESIGIHPGIVAGRMQHDLILTPSRCSKFKEKYIIEINRLNRAETERQS